MLSFERPSFLLLAPLSAAAFAVVSRFRRGLLDVSITLGPPGGESFSPPVGADLAVKLLRFAEVLGLFCFFIALAGPVSVTTEPVYLERGADVVFVVDASPSMSALDMDGSSRFAASKRLAAEFLDARGADAVGLVAVGRDAALLVPPTVDHDAFRDRLDTLRIAELGDGTALGLGLSIAALHLRSSPAKRKIVVLLTDGENNAGSVHPETAAAALSGIGASLWVVGVGSTGEVPVDYVDPETGKRRTGLLDSRYDQEALRAVAEAGGGTFLSAPTPDAFAEAFSTLAETESFPVASRSRTRTASLHDPLIWAGLALLASARFSRRRLLGALL